MKINTDARTAPGKAPLPPIYVVDDNPEICRSLEALLSAYGFDVTCYTDPVDFVDRRQTLRSGVLLLDVRMPHMNGIDVLVAIQNDLSRLQTIVITAHGEIDLAVKAIKLGAKDFVQKPFREQVLLNAIGRAMGFLTSGSGNDQGQLDQLTPREREVVLALSRGTPNKMIAHELGISVRTVEMHRARAMHRLGCKTFAELLRRILHSTLAAP